MVSETAAELIAFTNALPEWLCKSRQEKVSLLILESWNMKVRWSHFIAGYMLQLFSGEALFGHVELLKEGKLFLFPHLHSKGLL